MPAYSDVVISMIKDLEAGKTFDKNVIHPEEGVFCMDGGIAYDEAGKLLSVKTADVIDEREY